MQPKLTLAEQSLIGRDFSTVLTQFSVYCYTCHVIMPKDTLVKRYDAATFTHESCPKTPLKNVAVHKYGN